MPELVGVSELVGLPAASLREYEAFGQIELSEFSEHEADSELARAEDWTVDWVVPSEVGIETSFTPPASTLATLWPLGSRKLWLLGPETPLKAEGATELVTAPRAL